MTENTPECRARLADADTATLGAATRAELIQLIEWMRATHETDRAITMCEAYECGVLDERRGLIVQRTYEESAQAQSPGPDEAPVA